MTTKTARKSQKVPKDRNAVVVGMLMRSQNGGAHRDRKLESRRKACRKWVMED